MKIIGLTGSIGMGKSGVAAMLRRLRLAVFDVDGSIHRIYDDPVVGRVLALTFPEATDGKHAIDRQKLGELVFKDAAQRARLVAVLYPALAVLEKRFLRTQALRRQTLAVLDIPLLYETGGIKRVDASLVAAAPPYIQRARALKRPGMTAEKLAAILALQIPNTTKCRWADSVVQTGCARGVTLRELKKELRRLQQKLARCRGVWDNFIYARNRR